MSWPQPVFDDERQSRTQYLGAVRRHGWLIALTVGVAVVIATFYVLVTPKRYEAEAQIHVTPITEAGVVPVDVHVIRDPLTGPVVVGRSLKTPQVTSAVASRLGVDATRKELLSKVDIAPIQQSSLVSIKARDDDPKVAADIANAFPEVLIRQKTEAFQRELRSAVERMRAQIDNPTLSRGEAIALDEKLAQARALLGSSDPTIEVFSKATEPGEAIWPRPVLSIVVALFVGLILGIGAAILADLAEPKILSESELPERIPVLARVPRAPTSVVERYLRGRGPLPAHLWEVYRTLRASIVGQDSVGGAKSVLVTSAIQAEGKTMTSTNLAIAMAASGHRVVLVDGDLRHSMVHSVFGVTKPSADFASVLYGNARADEALVVAPGYGERLRLLLPGDERPIDLLEPRRITDILNELKQEADIIIIDSPPMTEFADAVALADAADVVLIAVRLGRSRRDRFNELIRRLAAHGIQPAGFVVTAKHRLVPSLREQKPIAGWSRPVPAEAPDQVAEPL